MDDEEDDAEFEEGEDDGEDDDDDEEGTPNENGYLHSSLPHPDFAPGSGSRPK